MQDLTKTLTQIKYAVVPANDLTLSWLIDERGVPVRTARIWESPYLYATQEAANIVLSRLDDFYNNGIVIPIKITTTYEVLSDIPSNP